MRAWLPVAAWGGLLALWTAVQLLFDPEPVTVALLGGAALAVLAAAAIVARAGREEPRPLPTLSVSTVIAAVGLAGVVTGAELGVWSIALGGVVTVAGLVGVARERALRPRVPRRASDPEGDARPEGDGQRAGESGARP